MTGTESFLNYSTRARTLQSMLNFDAGAISDFTLAESMTLGMPADLQAEVNNHQLLLADPFAFGTFESRAGVFWNGIVKRKMATKTQIPSLAPNPSSRKNRPSRKENIWRVQSYLDSLGMCHFCKKACGSAHGACTGQRDRSFLTIPDSFQPPAQTDNYKPPNARGSSSPTAGRAVQPPAGRLDQAATVAGVTKEGLFPTLNAASVLALEALDAELLHAETED